MSDPSCLFAGELIVDLFCGGVGGASVAIEEAVGRPPDFAVNHDDYAIQAHEAAHPRTKHLRADILALSPGSIRGPVGLVWASPACTHFSEAKGGVPLDDGSRWLADSVVDWARVKYPRLIVVENVKGFEAWGPLYPPDYPVVRLRNRPIPERKGEFFQVWVGKLRLCGYRVEWRRLVASHFGAPTRRDRLFVVARRDREPIGWPVATHGPGLTPEVWADEGIDFGLPIESIFDRKRPLAEATHERLAHGVVRHVLEEEPYIVPAAASGGRHDVAAFIAKHYTGEVGQSLRRPLGTITKIDHHSLVTVELDGEGDAPRVAAFLTKYYGQGGISQRLGEPLHTICRLPHFGLVAVTIQGRTMTDLAMRMLEPRELLFCQGFRRGHPLIGSKRDQIASIGNSVSPHPAAALLRANIGERSLRRAA